jgi:Zn-dependent protease with chaperone function
MLNYIIQKNFFVSVLLISIGGVFWWKSGSDLTDWVFPLLAAYTALLAGIILAISSFFVKIEKEKNFDLKKIIGENIDSIFDVTVFIIIVLSFVFVLNFIGFWLSAFIALLSATIFLTKKRGKNNIIISIIFSSFFTVICYVVFMTIFYVPVPEGVLFSY